jgi:hypothetical protein
MRKEFTLSKREISHLIFLSGQRPTGYRIHCARLDGLDDIDTATAVVGFAIVKALREVAQRRPDLLPGSHRPATKPRRSAEKRHAR